MTRRGSDPDAKADPVEEAGIESFPASDPPSWTLAAGRNKDGKEITMGSVSPYRGGDRGRSWAPSPFMLLQREFSRLFDDVFQGAAMSPVEGQGATPAAAPRIDVSETDKEIRVTADLPGVDEQNVEVTVDDDLITIRGEKQMEREDERRDFRLLERAQGVFMRTIRLPFPVEAEQVQAKFSNGVLTLSIPKPEERQRGRRVQIAGAGKGQSAAQGNA